MQNPNVYKKFTGPARLNKAINTLRGIVAGIQADGRVVPDEVVELAHWVVLHEDLRAHQPFNEILPLIESAVADGQFNDEEREDLLWACDHICGFCDYYDDIAGSIQKLNGYAHGLLADRALTDEEIEDLQGWLQNNEFLAGTYPFDELYSLTASILYDGHITENERNTLIVALGELVDFRESYNLSDYDFSQLKAKYNIEGICALCPELSFQERSFVLTGESSRATRAEISARITALGGIVKTTVSRKTDYLIVGNEGNPCWAFSCYGRKIEDAVRFRKNGAKILIVNENDFWDAVLDAETGILSPK